MSPAHHAMSMLVNHVQWENVGCTLVRGAAVVTCSSLCMSGGGTSRQSSDTGCHAVNHWVCYLEETGPYTNLWLLSETRYSPPIYIPCMSDSELCMAYVQMHMCEIETNMQCGKVLKYLYKHIYPLPSVNDVIVHHYIYVWYCQEYVIFVWMSYSQYTSRYV